MAKVVRAIEEGFFGKVRRRKGEVFSIPDSAKVGKWMELIEAKAEKTEKVEKPAKQTKVASGKESEALA